MALTESSIEDKIQVVGEYKFVQVRTARVIYDDGVEISRSYSRKVLAPCEKTGDPLAWSNTDVTGESTEVQAICNGVWTDAVRTAYKAHIDAQET